MGDEMSEGYIGHCCTPATGGHAGGGAASTGASPDAGTEGWWCCVSWWEFPASYPVVPVRWGGPPGYGVEEINSDHCEESAGFQSQTRLRSLTTTVESFLSSDTWSASVAEDNIRSRTCFLSLGVGSSSFLCRVGPGSAELSQNSHWRINCVG